MWFHFDFNVVLMNLVICTLFTIAQMEATSIETTGEVIAQCSEAYQTLSNCWSYLPSTLTRNRPFSELVTSAFPAPKVSLFILNDFCS